MPNLRPGAVLVLACVSALPEAVAGQAKPQEGPSPSLASLLQASPLSSADRTALDHAIRTRDYAHAEQLLLKLVDENPRSTALLILLGSIFFLDGKHLDCAIAMRKADAIVPIDERSRFTLSMAYIALDHGDWARPELEKLAQTYPQNALYPYWLSRLDYFDMHYTTAVAHLHKAIEVDPKFMKAYENLGLCYDAMRESDEAIQAYQQAAQLNRQNHLHSPWPTMNLGALLVKLGRLDEAETYLKESLREAPRFPKAHFQLGLLLEKKRRSVEAIRELKEAAACDPSYPEPYFVLGRIYRRMGDEKNAQVAYETFQRLSSIEKQKAVRRLH